MDDEDIRALYPEHIKLQGVKRKSQTCGEFLDWLMSSGRILACYHKCHTEACYDEDDELICSYRKNELIPLSVSIETLLGEYFGIDPQKLEAEKQQILEKLKTLESINEA